MIPKTLLLDLGFKSTANAVSRRTTYRMKEHRKQLRKALMNKRSQLPKNLQKKSAKLLCTQFMRTLLFLRGNRLAFYFANKTEIDPSMIFQQAIAMGKECYFPILHPVRHNRMLFGHYQLGDDLYENAFGIPEPDIANTEIVSPQSLDLIITPLVGFDAFGNRLGMGGGYYDRTFSFKNEGSHRPLLIGLAYDFQQVELIAPNHWDVPLDMVITPTKRHIFNQKQVIFRSSQIDFHSACVTGITERRLPFCNRQK